MADTDADRLATDKRVRELVEGEQRPAVVGLLHAVGVDEPFPLPLLATVVLAPLSREALRIWLRTKLRGEPSDELVAWLSARGGGLVGRTERELARLADSGSLTEAGDGTWSVSPAALARAQRVRRTLPVATTALVGRDRDVARIAALLSDRRLVTLVGPAGVGKTRLAIEVAGARAEDYADGVAYLPLDGTATEHQVTGDRLLVLDQVGVPVSGAFTARLLASAPGVRVLATSRQRLRLSGEQVYPVAPLRTPDLDHLPDEPYAIEAALALSPALAMFVARARYTRPDQLLVAAEICRRTGGLPLAIELLAAACDHLAPAEILARLGERTGLWAAVELSVGLLDDDGRNLLRAMAVHADARGAALVERALVGVETTPTGRRYTVPEAVRAYVNGRAV